MLFRAVSAVARRLFGRSRDDRTDSVAVLYDRALELTDADMADAVRRAFPAGASAILRADDLPPPPYAPDAPPSRSVQFTVNRCVIGVVVGSFPYSDVGEGDAAEGPLMEAFARNRGWTGVYFFGGPRPEDVYGLLGRVAAELTGAGATLVLVPSLMLAAQPTEELVEAMRGGRWFDRLAPIIAPHLRWRQADDPALKAAAEEARSRFDEFVRAFEDSAGAGFSAKFAFAEGDDVEHMWVAVESINGDAILGTLGNEPGVVSNISEGDPVSRRLDELEDWLYMDGKEMVGGFSVRVMLGEDDAAQ